MILLKMLPGVLKELVKHVPTVLFKVVHWHELASELPKISKRLMKKEGYEKIFEHQKTFLAPFNIKLTDAPLKKAAYVVTKKNGEKLLHLYFAQLFSEQGLFLDLRPIHFHAELSELEWHPTGLWIKFSESFRLGLLDVYEGFYLENEPKYLKGLKAISLLDDAWSSEDKKHLSELFKGQFGSALTSEMGFNLDDFRDSILKTSEFMLQKQVNISNDFLYLGIYLVTLYAHLEQSKEKYPVKEIYMKVRRHFQPVI
ncbi:MAG TPA: hypothetical protein VNJ08_07665 [Bacteriovoracaceae bacterium]|nr:hypothetical protein [Bacteriovoracaceae bacterium]